MQGLPTRLKNSAFLRHNTVFFVGSLFVGALNYLYYPVLGRLMQPAAFGEVQTLVSLFLQLTIFLTVLGLVTVNIAANYENESKRNAVIFELEKLAFIVSLVLLVLSVIFAGQFKQWLKFDDSLPFILLMITLVLTVPLTFRSSFIRGKKRFGLVSAGNMLGAGFKIIFSALLVMVGLGTGGAMLGVALSQIVALIFTLLWAVRLGLLRTPDSKLLRKPDWSILAPELKYALLVLVCSLIVTAQFSIDIVVVKYFFDAHTAGLYAGVATVARSIFFLTGSIAIVLMPSIKLKQPAAQNRALLVKSLGLVGICAVPCALIFAIFPDFIIRTLMGAEYVEYAHLLPLLSLTILLVSVINLLVSYYAALRRYSFAVVMVLGAVITYILMFMNHQDPRAVVNSLLYGSITILGLTAIWAGWSRIKGRDDVQNTDSIELNLIQGKKEVTP